MKTLRDAKPTEACSSTTCLRHTCSAERYVLRLLTYLPKLKTPFLTKKDQKIPLDKIHCEQATHRKAKEFYNNRLFEVHKKALKDNLKNDCLMAQAQAKQPARCPICETCFNEEKAPQCFLKCLVRGTKNQCQGYAQALRAFIPEEH